MKPFVLKQHEKDFAKVRELRASELETVSGGRISATVPGREPDPIKLNTLTVTPDHDGGDDGKDEG